MTRVNKCRVAICDRSAGTQLLCSPHRIRLRRYGDVRESDPIGVKISRRTERSRVKECTGCGEDTKYKDALCRTCRIAPCVTCHEGTVSNASMRSNGECRSCWRKRWRAGPGGEREIEARKTNPHFIRYQREYEKRPEVKLRHNARRKTTRRRKRSRIQVENARAGPGHPGLTVEEWDIIAASGACHYCGLVTDRLEMDHVIPLSRGGIHGPDNIVAACRSCNARKHDRTPEEWRADTAARRAS